MRNAFLLVTFMSSLLLISCSPAQKQTDGSLVKLDKNTEYRIDEKGGGFVIYLSCSQYQFVPDTRFVCDVCRNQLFRLAAEHAKSMNKHTKAIDERLISISPGRDGFSGMSKCNLMIEVMYDG